jgi:hypothetical protein
MYLAVPKRHFIDIRLILNSSTNQLDFYVHEMEYADRYRDRYIL